MAVEEESVSRAGRRGSEQPHPGRQPSAGGAIKHRIAASLDYLSAPVSAGPLADRINGAAPSLTVTPTGSNATTAFAGGLKIDSAAGQLLHFDTSNQTIGKPLGIAIVSDATVPGADLRAVPGLLSENINGVTRTRLTILFEQAPGSAPFLLNSSTIGNGSYLFVDFVGFLE
jgi:hypothetical protein